MRVLWVSNFGGNYKDNVIKGTGGWIGALQDALTQNTDIELGITFPHIEDSKPIKDGKVSYYPVYRNIGKSNLEKLYLRYFHDEKKQNRDIVRKMIDIVNDFKPDIIHVWGIEEMHSMILEEIKDIPTVVHIQGLASAYIHAYIPAGYSIKDIKKSDTFIDRILLRRGSYHTYKLFRQRLDNELRYSKFVKNWIGRTDWDKCMSKMLSPNSRYFYGLELMRNDFDDAHWQYHYDGKTINIHSSISADWYKGMDIVLKTADILKSIGVNVIWNIYGWEENNSIYRYMQHHEKISGKEVGIVCHGRVNAKRIKEGLLSADVFVHPSYIENSSNAIVEAMMLGVPTIAQNVGGNATMLRDNSGVLVAPNEPYIMAYKIMEMTDKSIATGYSERARAITAANKDKNAIIKQLVKTYETLIHDAGI